MASSSQGGSSDQAREGGGGRGGYEAELWRRKEEEDKGMTIHGIVVQVDRKEVGVFNSWIHTEKKRAVEWMDRRDSTGHVLRLGDWVTIVWRRDRNTRHDFLDKRPVSVRVCARSGELQVRAPLTLLAPDPGKSEQRLWSDDFHAVGLLPHLDRAGWAVGDKRDVWMEWMSKSADRDRHLQKTGYDVVWRVALEQEDDVPQPPPAAAAACGSGGGGASVQQVQQLQQQPQPRIVEESNEEVGDPLSHVDRVRIHGSYPRRYLNRVGIISGHKELTPFYYVWTPGAPPRMEGRLVAPLVDGKEVIRECDWIHFRVSDADTERIFRRGEEVHRFEVVEWEWVRAYCPTQLSPNKLTIEIALRNVVLCRANTSMGEGGEVVVEDADFGAIADRSNFFAAKYPIAEGRIIAIDCVIRRVKPRPEIARDSAWMILRRDVLYEGEDDRAAAIERPAVRGESRREQVGDRGGGRGRGDDDIGEERTGGRRRRRAEEEEEERRQQNRRDHYLLNGPKCKGREVGAIVESVAIVEGVGEHEAYVWLTDAAASGVVNGGAEYLVIGDVVYGTFRLQSNGKWSSRSGRVQPGELPRQLQVHVRKDRLFVTAPVIYDAVQGQYTNPWFETVFDADHKLPRDPVDLEVRTLELTKIRHGFNISADLTRR